MKRILALLWVILCLSIGYAQTSDDTKKTEDELEDVVDEAKTKINKVKNKDTKKNDEIKKNDENQDTKETDTTDSDTPSKSDEAEDDMITERDPALRDQARSYRNGGIALLVTGSVIALGVGLPVTLVSTNYLLHSTAQDENNYHFNMILLNGGNSYPTYTEFLWGSLITGIAIMSAGVALDLLSIPLFVLYDKTMKLYRKGVSQSLIFDLEGESMRLGLSLRF